MSKVFVVNKGGHDYSAAERYGRLVFCTDGTMPRYNTNQMYREISHAMHDSAPDDYILLTSLTILNVVACSIFAARHGKVNLLLYQSKKGGGGEYLERTISFTNPNRPEAEGERRDCKRQEDKGGPDEGQDREGN